MNEDQKAFVDQLKYGQSFMLDGKRIDPKDIYMDKKPEALRLADDLESVAHEYDIDRLAAAELRRLHQMNQELVEALEEFIRNPAGDNTEENAIAILAKHKEQA